MAKKKEQRRKDVLAEKSAVENIRFQTHWGLKKLGFEDGGMLHDYADVELGTIIETGLVKDILTLKKLVDGVKQALQVEPTPECGDFIQSCVSIALGIAKISDLNKLQVAELTWNERVEKKLLKVFYPDDQCNAVADWAKQNGFNTSTFLGRPLVKLSKLYIVISRAW